MHVRPIYGEEIIYCGYKRSQCTDCGTFFNQLFKRG